MVAEWLHTLTETNKLKGEELKNVLDWLSTVEDLTSELKSKLIQILSQFIERNPIRDTDIQYISSFLDNTKISSQLNLHIDDYLTITITLLQYLRNNENILLSQKILNNFIKYYRESKKKLEFITKLLNGKILETIFSFLDTECRKTVLDLCQNILFPITKRSYFISFLQTLIRKDNLEELIAEKGDNIQSVIKIMNTFFEFPKNRSINDPLFLKNFIDVFVSAFHKENQIVFAFYIMVANVLNMEQTFIVPAMNLPCILQENDAKTTRALFLNMLEVLVKNEIDINVRLTDTFGEKISKVEIKKNFTSFIQAVMMGQLKLEGKPDKTTLEIIKTAMKLDPVLIEQKLNIILPPIMTAKKNNSTIEPYKEMLSCLLEILFKLSRGTSFTNEILPSVKDILEACNTEQFELKKKEKVFEDQLWGGDFLGIDREALAAVDKQIIRGRDLFPDTCVEVYGKLTSELMFRQNKELLESLQKNLEVYCLMMLEEGFVSPSIITLTSVLSAILSSFLEHNKMADHTVPQNIAEDFWEVYRKFENECLSKFGQCILKLSFNASLMVSFLSLCQSFAQLKILNIKYSNVKLDILQVFLNKYNNDDDMDDPNILEALDMSLLLPCLDSKQWNEISKKNVDPSGSVIFDYLLATKTVAIDLLTASNQLKNKAVNCTKDHLIQECIKDPRVIENNCFFRTILRNLDNSHAKALAKSLVNTVVLEPQEIDLEYFQVEPIKNNKYLQNIIVLQTAKNITKCFENEDILTKALNKSDFNMAAYANEVEITNYFNQISLKPDTLDTIKVCLKIFKAISISHLDENYQLVAIFVMLAIKQCCNVKRVKRTVDNILQNIFELSIQRPDLYQIFPVDAIFDFKNRVLFDLLTLKLNTSNNMLIIKSLLELAVKKVRADSDQVKSIVEKLLKKKKKKAGLCMESFNNPIFQITCIILPLIIKQKKAITSSAFRSILADLQEKLHQSLLESFKNIDFSNVSIFSTGNPDDSELDDNNMATLNAMAAYSLTLSKYCETTDADEIKNLEYLWTGLDFFVQSAIKSIENPASKPENIESAINLLNVVLRYMKKLETHPIFQEKGKIFLQIWRSIKAKLLSEQDVKTNGSILEDIGVTLRFVCELTTVECFTTHIIGDLGSLVALKKPSLIVKNDNTDLKSRKVFKYLWSQCLKANIVGPKCIALAKLMHRTCKNLRNWMRQHYETESVARFDSEVSTEDAVVEVIKVDDCICELIRLDLDSLCEILLAAKKVSLDYKFVDNVFELQHLIHYIIGVKSYVKCEISWQAFFTLFEGCVAVLNILLVAREEVIEDRWPCYMQCYRALTTSLCERSSTHTQLEPQVDDKLAELAHSIEKLTQSISKRKKHVSRIAAYTVADLCTSLEKNAPNKKVRQHIENSVALLIQASDNTYAMAFLKRALAGSAGQMTMTNLYAMYKRYHKYVGNA